MIKVYTDGACSDNPGPGGWAAVFPFPACIKHIEGMEKQTTNNRMELKAVVESLKWIRDNRTKMIKKRDYKTIELYSDSAYVVNSINKNWLEVWKTNGWKTTKGDDVKNRDLWEEFYEVRKSLRRFGYTIEFIKVKGHSGDTFNEMVDKFARQQSEVAKRELR